MRRLLMLAVMAFMVLSCADAVFAGSGNYPDSPVQVSPVNYYGGSTVNFTAISYTNNYYGDTAVPSNYFIEVYEGSSLVTSGYLGSSTLNLPGFPDDGTTYTWRVYADYDFYDTYGNYYGSDTTYWSPFVSFVNGPSTIPSQPVLSISPSNGSGTEVILQWDSDRATDYYLQVATDANYT